MRRNLISLSVLAGILTLTGCASPFGKQGYIRDKSGDYVAAEVSEPIEVPASANPRQFGDVLVIPEITREYDQLPEKFDVPRPIQRLSFREGDSFSLERDDTGEWLMAGESPAEVWPKVLRFLEDNNVEITTQAPQAGVIETGWADFGGDPTRGIMYRTFGRLVGVDDAVNVENRFRFEVRAGIQDNFAEVRISHQGRPPVAEGDTAPEPEEWDNLGDRSLRLDNGLLQELLVYLASSDHSSVSRVAQDLSLDSLMSLEKDGNGNPILTVREASFARIWGSVSSALGEAGLKIVDRNRSSGVFYLADDSQQITEPEEEKGFWSGLFGGGDKKKATEEEKEETLSVRVSSFTDSVQVSVEKDVNTSAPADVSEKLLQLIRDNMK